MRDRHVSTVVTERGQTSIPAEVRKEMGLHPGVRLVWERLSDDELRVSVVREHDADPVAMLGFARRFRETRTTSEWMQELREGER